MIIEATNNMNINFNEKQSKRYKKKYKYLRLRIKSLLLENAALCDEVAKIQESILIVKDERKFLLRKLLEYENEIEISSIAPKSESTVTLNGNSRGKTKKRQSFDDSSKTIALS